MGRTVITKQEVKRQIERLKKEKAPGGDGIKNEAWLYGTEEVIDRLTEIMNEVWKGKGFPRQWTEGVICPIHKKGNTKEAQNYRGITLLNTSYKLYAMVLGERMKEEIERKGILPDSQAGFRMGRGTIDNVYILNHIVEKEIQKKAGKVYALFVDLKATFDSVNREKLWEYLRGKGVSKELVKNTKEIYEETKNKVKLNGKESEWFWTKGGLRQGCPLSPTLFTIYLSDIDEMLKKAQAGRVPVGREKVWCLAYADDLVLVANEERGMKDMIRNAERYMKKKKLEVNVDKTKMMIFRKERGRAKESEWKWTERKIEQEKEFKYLGCL